MIACLRSAQDWYTQLGIRFKALLTDNGVAYRSKQFAQACHHLGLKHRFTRPYTPRTNGKAERFIQIALREWAYAHVPELNRTQPATPILASHLQLHRPHASLKQQPPISRSGLDRNNLLSHHT